MEIPESAKLTPEAIAKASRYFSRVHNHTEVLRRANADRLIADAAAEKAVGYCLEIIAKSGIALADIEQLPDAVKVMTEAVRSEAYKQVIKALKEKADE